MNVPTIVQARSKGVNTSWTNRYGEVVSLTDRQKELLSSFGSPTDFEGLTDEEYFAIDELMSDEMQLHGLSDDGLNDYDELCARASYSRCQSNATNRAETGHTI